MNENFGGYKPPKREPVKKKAPKPDPVYVATGSFLYRFKDGTYLRLQEGVKVDVTGPRLQELKKFKHVREVK
jgi:hypothetical protein